MRRTAIAILVLAVALCAAAPAAFAKRVAFVVGVDAYDNLPANLQLKKALGDAHAVGDALKGLGYEVIEADNVGRLDFLRQWQQFLNRIEPGDEAAFYYAGHGVEIAGLNYLLPRDVPAVASGEEEVLKASGLAFNNLLDQVREKRPQVSLHIIDACRDNPFNDNKGRGIGGTRGLALVAPPKGTFVMYSASANESALDRLSDGDSNPNSVYTRTLLPRLRSPGKSITEIAREVRREVNDLAQSVNHVQTPAYYDEVIGEFCPAGCDARPVASAQPDAPAAAPAVASIAPPARAPAPAAPQAQTAELTPQVVQGPPSAGRAPVHDCDRLAADENNPDSAAPGVNPFMLNKDRATIACRDAVAAYPNERRFSFQLARVFYDSNRPDLARPRLEELSRDGYPIASTFLGYVYENGSGIPEDKAKALQLFHQAADQGDGLGTFAVAMAYEYGSGVDKNEAEALRWYEKAAAIGNVNAMLRLGQRHAEGKLGLAKDDGEATSWYRKAAERGNVDGIYRLALMYRTGRGVAKDDAEAARLIAKGDEAKATFAMVDIGQKLYGGAEDFGEDKAEAMTWFTKAADLGDRRGMFYIGLAHRYGAGAPRDIAEAVRWYGKAAELGDPTAMAGLAEMYDKGEGVPQDAGEAERWRKASHAALYAESGSPAPEDNKAASDGGASSAPARGAASEPALKVFGPLEHSVVSVAFSPSGDGLYALASGGYFVKLDLASGAVGAELGLISDRGCCKLVVSPDGKYLATGSYSNLAMLWNAQSGELVRTFKGHTDYVVSVDIAPDGKTLATASYDKTIKLWDIESGKLLRTLKGHIDKINAVAFSPDGKTLASGGWDHVVKLWDAGRGSLIASLKGPSGMINAVAFTPDGARLLSAGAGGEVFLWDVAAKTRINNFTGSVATQTSAAISPDGSVAATGGGDEVRLWDMGSGGLLRSFAHSDTVQSLAYSPDGKTLASGANDKTVKVWQLDDRETAGR